MADKKVVLVTGASSGIGERTALLLSDRGYEVYGTSRSPKPENSKGFKMLKLDVDSDESVRSCVGDLISIAGRIDVLVNNAGYISTASLEETSIEDAKSQFETNFFGAAKMVNAVLPYMRKQKRGQIINISSLAGIIPAPFQSYYAPTKAALSIYSDQLRNEVKNIGIKVSVVEPGFIKTGILSKVDSKLKNIDEYKNAKANTISEMEKYIDTGQDPKIVADTVLKIIESQSPHLHYQVGKEKIFVTLKKLLPESIFESLARNYWKLDK